MRRECDSVLVSVSREREYIQTCRGRKIRFNARENASEKMVGTCIEKENVYENHNEEKEKHGDGNFYF